MICRRSHPWYQPSRVVIIRKLRAIVAKVPPLRPPWVNYGGAEYGSMGVLGEQPATQSRQQRKGETGITYRRILRPPTFGIMNDEPSHVPYLLILKPAQSVGKITGALGRKSRRMNDPMKIGADAARNTRKRAALQVPDPTKSTVFLSCCRMGSRMPWGRFHAARAD
ncbi:hypothetical protein BO83DRAFT_219013 [Aspergillus eucalypticola CBS 122712]|uniref:Uncharacterized protein n=1 Tax=Aspergillus eucalypticola (strain CBS 122712 / IBT 29274) TaxID=1448314 RepID=A0A317W1F1_ASPEC|nr:uncharacterized protein BO83DRAFT_219013 [Aspergillus eucalypticola CBS 122712]PWY79057.1 hypothetical protein BO83DRAFT_219013 [Aspergillus eucalypticola CBS 122712]